MCPVEALRRAAGKTRSGPGTVPAAMNHSAARKVLEDGLGLLSRSTGASGFAVLACFPPRTTAGASDTLITSRMPCSKACFCESCHHALTPAHSIVRRKKYRYYICTTRQKLGAHRCPSKPLPAGTIENAVLEQLWPRASSRPMARLPEASPTSPQRSSGRTDCRETTLAKELTEGKKKRRLARHVASGKNGDTTAISRLADLQEQVLSGDAAPRNWLKKWWRYAGTR